MSDLNKVPVLDGEIVKRQMHFLLLTDCSGSMDGSKISSLNRAIPEAIAAVQKSLEAHPEVQVMIRAIKFSDTAQWHMGPKPVAIEDFIWSELYAGGKTATASAIHLLTEALDIENMSKRAFPPVCILLSDGFCTESEEAYVGAIAKLDSMPWGKKAIRLVIAIGNESEYNEEALLKFTNHKEVGLLKAKNPEQLVDYIKWASTTASLSASVSKSTTANGAGPASNVELPKPPEFIDNSNVVF